MKLSLFSPDNGRYDRLAGQLLFTTRYTRPRTTVVPNAGLVSPEKLTPKSLARMIATVLNFLCCRGWRNQEDTVSVSYQVQVAPSNAAPLAGSHRRDAIADNESRDDTVPDIRRDTAAEDKRRDAIMARVE